MTVITVHSRLLAASTPVCPVVHTTLNWIVIAGLFSFTAVILASLCWSIYDHRRARTPDGDDARSGEKELGRGVVHAPQLSDRELEA